MADFIEYNVESRPSWLRRAVGEAYLLVLGVVKQACVEAMREAVQLGLPQTAPPDALPLIALDRAQEPGFEGETVEQLRGRLLLAFPIARGRGWQSGMLNELRRIGYPNAQVYDQYDDPDGTVPFMGFRVVLNRPFPFDDQHLADGVWDDPGTWSDGGPWAAAIPPKDLTILRAVVRRNKAVFNRCVGIRVKYNASNPLDVVTLDP